MSKPTKAIIFNKYQIKKLIASTHFGYLYEGINIKTKEPVAIKFEKKASKFQLLESEAYMLFLLRGFGIPKLISYGKNSLFNILIEELLGLSIQAIWNNKKYMKKYQLKDICMIALQCLDRLEYIHSKDIIHRDIKPLNTTIGKEDPNLIYLIDFGFAHKFRSTRTGKHIRYKNIKKVLGSLRYLSINANKGFEQSRRDDLESLGYMLVYLSKNTLPWMNFEKKGINKVKKYKLVCASKIKNKPEILCSGMPIEFSHFLAYVRNLEFEQEPNYNYMRKLFLEVLNRNNDKNDLMFSWILNKKIKIGSERKSPDNKSYDKIISLNKNRRHKSQTRLYKKIKKSLEIERARSYDESNKRLKLNFLEENKKINLLPLDKRIEKKLKINSISPNKEVNKINGMNFIYKRKKIQNTKIIKKIKENKDNIPNNLIFNNNLENIITNSNKILNDNLVLSEEKKKNNYRKSLNDYILFKHNYSNNKYNKNVINISKIHNSNNSDWKNNSNNTNFEKIKYIKNRMVNKQKNDISSYNFKPNNMYKTLKEREKFYNYSDNKINYFNRINENKNIIKKIPIIGNIRNVINEFTIKDKSFARKVSRNKNITPKTKKINYNNYNLNSNSILSNNNNRIIITQNNSRSPQNDIRSNNFNRFHLNNTSYNNLDENTFKSNGFINFNLNLEELKYKPDIKINKNYNINIINHRKINSYSTMFGNDSKSYEINNYSNINSLNYIPFSLKKSKKSYAY